MIAEQYPIFSTHIFSLKSIFLIIVIHLYIFDGIICIPCQDPLCASCGPNGGFGGAPCYGCQNGAGFNSTGWCTKCADPACIQCNTSSNLICDSCPLGYALRLGICDQCTNNCYRCVNNSYTCTQCSTHYYLSINRTCQLCDPSCLNCIDDSITCISCSTHYYFSSYATCSICDSNCYKCSNYAATCTQCYQQRQLNLTDNKCYCPKFCTDCGWDAVNSVAQCIACIAGPYQLNLNSINLCMEICTNGFGNQLPSVGGCLPCPPTCLSCSLTDYHNCTCVSGQYPGVGQCISCSTDCKTCSGPTYCDSCLDGLYLGPDNLCYPCSQNCQICIYNPTHALPECTSCSQYQQLDNLTIPAVCKQICGDQITFTYPCDYKLQQEWDGCNDSCQIQTDFQCLVNNFTICSYKGQIQYKFIDFFKQDFRNQFTLIIQVYPPLYILQIASPEQIATIFKIQSPLSLQMLGITYDSKTHQLTFHSTFSQTIQSLTFNLSFIQHQGSAIEYISFGEVVIEYSGSSQLTHYTEEEFKKIEIIKVIGYFVMGLGWIITILGAALRRLAGLEAMFVLQMSWIVIFWLDSNLFIDYQTIIPLKYTCLYNPQIYPKQQLPKAQNSQYCPHYRQFPPISGKNFSNNYNLSLFIQFAVLLLVLITYIRMVCLRKVQNAYSFEDEYKNNQNKKYLDNEKLQENFKKKKEYIENKKKINHYYEIFSQIWMYISLLNLLYFVMCIVLYLKFGIQNLNESAININATNLTFMLLGLLSYVGIFWRFWIDPYTFGHFREQFKNKTLATKHLIIYCAILVGVVVVVCVVPSLPWIGIILCFLLIFYTLVKKPYNYRKENYRSAINLVFLCYQLLLKTLIQYVSPNRPTPILSILTLINISLILPLTIILAIASILYYYYYENYQKPRQQQQLKKTLDKAEKSVRDKILLELSLVNVNNTLGEIGEGAIVLRGYVSPRYNILGKSNQLNQQEIQNQMEGMRVGMERAGVMRKQEIGGNQQDQQNCKQDNQQNFFSIKNKSISQVLNLEKNNKKRLINQQNIYTSTIPYNAAQQMPNINININITNINNNNNTQQYNSITNKSSSTKTNKKQAVGYEQAKKMYPFHESSTLNAQRDIKTNIKNQVLSQFGSVGGSVRGGVGDFRRNLRKGQYKVYTNSMNDSSEEEKEKEEHNREENFVGKTGDDNYKLKRQQKNEEEQQQQQYNYNYIKQLKHPQPKQNPPPKIPKPPKNPQIKLKPQLLKLHLQKSSNKTNLQQPSPQTFIKTKQNKQQDNSSQTSTQLVTRNKQMLQNPHSFLNEKVICNTIIREENFFVQFRAAEQVTLEEMCQVKDPNQDVYIEAYENIDV